MKRPASTLGLRHVALYVIEFEACLHFYTELLGMQIEWFPDKDNVYLTTGHDNLALHRAPDNTPLNTESSPIEKPQRLDHIGFILSAPEEVDEWYDFLQDHQVVMKSTPKQHRDGARSFYCQDPDRYIIQMIYHPPLVQNQ